jgi:thioester reductase-like protein
VLVVCDTRDSSVFVDLCTVLVEKILRVQPGVKKLFLLVRATDHESAKRRMQTEVKYFFRQNFLPQHFI